jgi:hypothetical protein
MLIPINGVKVLEEFKVVSDESIFLDLTPEEVTLLFFILGIIISQSLTIDDLNTLANGLFETAQVMFLIAAQRSLINDLINAQQEKEDAAKLKSELQKLQDKIEYLQKQLDELKK